MQVLIKRHEVAGFGIDSYFVALEAMLRHLAKMPAVSA